MEMFASLESTDSEIKEAFKHKQSTYKEASPNKRAHLQPPCDLGKKGQASPLEQTRFMPEGTQGSSRPVLKCQTCCFGWMEWCNCCWVCKERRRKQAIQGNEHTYAAKNTGRKVKKMKASKNETRQNPTRRIFTKSVKNERLRYCLVATRGLANVRRMERLEEFRTATWNKEEMLNVEGSTKASIFIWIKTRTMQIRKKPII